MLCAELRNIRVRGGVNIEPVSFEKFFKTAVEFEFVVYIFHIFGIVETLDERVVDPSRHNGLSLCAVEIVHLEQRIVHISRLIFQTAVDHVKEYINSALSRFFVYFADLFKHLVEVHRKDPSEQIFNLSQNKVLLFGATPSVVKSSIP